MIGGILAGAVVVYLLFKPDGNGRTITNKIDSLRAVVRWKEIREARYRDSIRTKDKAIDSAHKVVKKAKDRVSLAEAGTEQWRQRYYVLKKIMPHNAKDSLRDMVAVGNACDSLVDRLEELSEARGEQVTAITGELIATQAKVIALDTLNLTISSENRDLKEMDSLHLKNEKILKRKAKKAFLKGALIGVPIGVIVALFLI